MRVSRILVAIANHGTKNRHHLDRLLAAYRAMPFDVDLVVLSDQPKELGDDVEVLVGAPSDNPWSLPFAHRPLFIERADRYDLFIYSEDDTLVTEEHIRAFVEVDALLSDDEVPGFLRFEEHPTGERSYCSIHSAYRWEPGSAERRDGEVFASYSNQHSACYLLTRAQLQRAIASGGFVVEPYEGEYDMLVTAATDPYTRCGLRRRICVSRIDEFLLHHLPNVYLGKLGVTEAEFRAQLDAVTAVAAGDLDAGVALSPASTLPTIAWDLPYHPRATSPLAELCQGAHRALSIGATAGMLERSLFGDQAVIAAVPVDEVIAAVARTRGLTTLPAHLDSSLDELRGQRFDRVLLHETLPHVPDPARLLRRLVPLLAPAGRIIVSVPNLRYHRLRTRLGRSSTPLPRRGFEHDGVHATDPAVLRRWARAAGLRIEEQRFELTDAARRPAALLPGGEAWLGETVHASMRVA